MATYQIIIKLPGQGEKQSVVSGQQSTKKSTSESREDKAYKAIGGLVSYATVSHFADTLISNEISMVELQTGAQEYEQKLQFYYGVTKKTTGIIAAGIAGAKVGGLIGAGIGLIGSVVYTAISYSQNARAIRTKQNLEDISLGMARIRAGISGRRSPNQ